MRNLIAMAMLIIFGGVVIYLRVWRFWVRPDLTEPELFWMFWPLWLGCGAGLCTAIILLHLNKIKDGES